MNKPNIVFILIDDMGWVDLSCMGSTFYATPNIDRLAAEGIAFSDAYASCPVCSPTRASILSGKYPARVGVTNFIGGSPAHSQRGGDRGRLLAAPYTPYLAPEEKSIARALKEHGYQTWHVGKWHLSGYMNRNEKGPNPYWPENHGFDVNIGGCSWGMPFGRGGYFLPWDHPTLEPREGDDYLTDRLGDEAAQLIRESDDRPFFLNMCFHSVHIPIQAKEETIQKYREKATAMGLDEIEPFAIGDFFPSEHKKKERIKRRLVQSNPVYAAMIEHLDENVGKILDALEAKGVAENTIVVFTSDNGGTSTSEGSPTCNAPLSEGKGWMYDGGLREPLLVRWPGRIAPGTTTDALVTSPDFYPTLLEAAGLPPEPQQHVDGMSFLPVLNGASTHDRGGIFWHFPHYGNQGGLPGCAIRKGDWKLIEFFEDDSIELYNLADDISETHNVASGHPEIVEELLVELHDWQHDVGALYPEPNPDFTPWRDADLKAID
ncbi:MAG: sulfatase [Lentisphaerae bacterium]|jgi:arylsulfatase A-like enzyme|nr:sulfatase [Lentisphaerota bacterium]MBT4814757.1 sulfatase [Lentisphaerota bacterium]MBT5606149.1 sulfatase [Lentisphaerota bacterium]MBT7056368.1 sulfatase [Lentisphaerota bacterium]MBT7842956.1 sulfatase [Lentisphaerota bacterium]